MESCICLCPAYFTWHNVFKVHPYYSMHKDFIPFYDRKILHYMYILHFVYPFICWGILRLFYFSDSVSNTPEQWSTSTCTYVWVPFWCLHRSGIKGGSYGDSMFKFLRYHQTLFHSSWITLYSQQQSIKVPMSPHPHQHLLFSFFKKNNNSHLNVCEEVFPCGLDLDFPNN